MHPQGLEQIPDAIDHMYAGKNTVRRRRRRENALSLRAHDHPVAE